MGNWYAWVRSVLRLSSRFCLLNFACLACFLARIKKKPSNAAMAGTPKPIEGPIIIASAGPSLLSPLLEGVRVG